MRDLEWGLTATRLRELLHYDPQTGAFTWRVMVSARCRHIGASAGDLKADSGYILIGVDGRRYRAHRLAWLYMTGLWPTRQVDHIDGQRANNRWNNLREATQQQNSANMRRRSSNLCGIKGVSKFVGLTCIRWRAHIMVNGKANYLGSFDNPEDARRAYESAATLHFGLFARAA